MMMWTPPPLQVTGSRELGDAHRTQDRDPTGPGYQVWPTRYSQEAQEAWLKLDCPICLFSCVLVLVLDHNLLDGELFFRVLFSKPC